MPRFQRSRHLVGPASAWRAPATGVASADELVGRTLSWFAVAALAYRLAITPILVAGAVGNQIDLPRSLMIAMGLVLAGDLVLLVGVMSGRFGWLLRSTPFFVVDLAVAAGLNLWATSTLPRGTLLWTGRDIVWGYGLGVISFWTALRGGQDRHRHPRRRRGPASADGQAQRRGLRLRRLDDARGPHRRAGPGLRDRVDGVRAGSPGRPRGGRRRVAGGTGGRAGPAARRDP